MRSGTRAAATPAAAHPITRGLVVTQVALHLRTTRRLAADPLHRRPVADRLRLRHLPLCPPGGSYPREYRCWRRAGSSTTASSGNSASDPGIASAALTSRFRMVSRAGTRSRSRAVIYQRQERRPTARVLREDHRTLLLHHRPEAPRGPPFSRGRHRLAAARRHRQRDVRAKDFGSESALGRKFRPSTRRAAPGRGGRSSASSRPTVCKARSSRGVGTTGFYGRSFFFNWLAR